MNFPLSKLRHECRPTFTSQCFGFLLSPYRSCGVHHLSIRLIQIIYHQIYGCLPSSHRVTPPIFHTGTPGPIDFCSPSTREEQKKKTIYNQGNLQPIPLHQPCNVHRLKLSTWRNFAEHQFRSDYMSLFSFFYMHGSSSSIQDLANNKAPNGHDTRRMSAFS